MPHNLCIVFNSYNMDAMGVLVMQSLSLVYHLLLLLIPFSFVVFAAPIISVIIFAYVLRHLLLLPFLLRVFLLP